MKILKSFRAAIPAIGMAALCFATAAHADRLVILHTNDTHSAIEPDAKGLGGILQRKVVFDSVRQANKNVITVDAGDMVQGSLFFKYFRGDVEYPLSNLAGYDIHILGNHEFDNGMEALAEHYKLLKGDKLSANYDFSGTAMDGVMKPYVIKKAGGKKIGFIGININPESLIAEKCIDVKFSDPIETANALAAKLKKEEKCDLVVAVTHIGYRAGGEKPDDVKLAQSSRDIDIIIGGHSHTLVSPDDPATPSRIPNAGGREVLVAQAGKSGFNVGEIDIDLDKIKAGPAESLKYSLIPVTDRFPEKELDKKMIAFLEPYRAAVDSVNNKVIGYAAYEMTNRAKTGGLANLTADFGLQYGRHIADSLARAETPIGEVDMAIMNVGGIRQTMNAGKITEGQILSTYPFSNRMMIIRLRGEDIIEAMRVAARKGGEAVSGNVRVVTDGDRNLLRVIIDGKEMDPKKDYIVATIDYLAEGNDDLRTLANHRKLWVDETEVSVPILGWFKRQTALGLPIMTEMNPRFVVDVNIARP